MPGPTIFQSNSTILSNGGAITSPLAFTNPVTAGNLIVVFWAGSGGIGNTVTDNNSPLSNVYTINEQSLGGDHGIVAYAVAGSSQALTVTVGNAGGLTPAYFAIVEVANWVSVDSVTNQGLAVVADPFTFNDTANFSNDLAIGMCSIYINGQTDTFGVGGGWNVLQNTVAGTLEYATVASGTVTFDFTTSATYDIVGAWMSLLRGYKDIPFPGVPESRVRPLAGQGHQAAAQPQARAGLLQRRR